MEDHPSGLPLKQPFGRWVQTDRETHELWAQLIQKSPIAARAMHIITANIGEGNAFIISSDKLAQMVNCSTRRLRDAVKLLEAGNWLEVRQLGQRGTVNGYIVNDRVAWTQGRDGLRHSIVTGTVYIAEEEQPDREHIGRQAPLRRIPTIYAGESQLPTGDGLPPVSQPFLGGMEPDLPARQVNSTDAHLHEPADARIIKSANNHKNLDLFGEDE